MALLRLVRECDLFRKLPTEHREAESVPDSAPILVLRSLTVVLIGFLAVSETWSFITPVRKQRFDLDQGDTAADAVDGRILAPKKFRVLLDVTVHGFPCIDLSLDYQDVMGTRAVDVRTTMFKQRLYKNGTAVPEAILANDPKVASAGSVSNPSLFKGGAGNSSCKSCYGALPDGECCNTCSDVLYAYRLKRWALPRIEDIEQCRHDGTAKSAYQPPQIIRLGEYSSDDYLPKFTKLSSLSSSGKEPRITTPFKMNFTLAPLKPLNFSSFNNGRLPLVLNFSSGADDDWNDDFGDDPDDDLFGDLDIRSRPKKKADKSDKVVKPWPDCIQRNVIIHGYDIGEALMIDLAKYGAKEGCWNNDCKETDKFNCESMEACATMCQKVDACQWWTWGEQGGARKCWIRSGKHGREKRYGFSSGPRVCVNGTRQNASDANASDTNVSSSATVADASASDSSTNTPAESSSTTKAPDSGNGAADKTSDAKDSSASGTKDTADKPSDAKDSTASGTKDTADKPSDAKDASASDTKEGTFDTQGRRMSSVADNSRTDTQPRRLFSFDDDLDGLSGHRPFSLPPLSLGPSPHMPIFGGLGMMDSRESEQRRQQKDESCRLYGYFDTNKVPGNFHIGTHGSMAPSYLSYFDAPSPTEQNMRHTINKLAFVEVTTNATLVDKQPLDGFESPKAFTFQYYLTVNPASQRYRKSPEIDGYQFRAGSFVTNELIGPAVFFRLDVDPVRVTYYDQEAKWSKFLTNLCAVVGGCIAVCSMAAQFFETASHVADE